MRPLVSYDDIASQAPGQEIPPSAYTEGQGYGSPPKKRRKNNRQGQRHRNSTQYDNDNGDDSPKPQQAQKTRKDYGLKEESRPLTHEEVWDDSALIHAWDAAVEEYEVLNGPDKKWKSEPVNKSALWFNVPPEKEKSSTPTPSWGIGLVPSIPTAFQGLDLDSESIVPSDPENSRPVNFDTFVPDHDPSLSHLDAGGSGGGQTGARASVVPPALRGVAGQMTKDQAFENAMGAWYWAGYWTGVYHTSDGTAASRVNVNANGPEQKVDVMEDEDEAVHDKARGEDEGVGEEDLIPT